MTKAFVTYLELRTLGWPSGYDREFSDEREEARMNWLWQEMTKRERALIASRPIGPLYRVAHDLAMRVAR